MIASKPLELAGSFKGPMIVVHGDKDIVVPASVNEAVIAAYPEASLVVVPEADHGYGFYSDQPDVTTLVDTTFAEFFAQNLK
jgi:fermentation-respiration switch protein FrsA (DUF1100 family)